MSCNSNYYTMRNAKVNIAHELMNRGWDVQGYKSDESDSMTDYYSPANWDGIATKNGFVLCIDTQYATEKTPIKKYNYNGGLSFDDQEKIKKLEALTQDRGATVGEETNAKTLIKKIKENKNDNPEYTITGYTIAHMANPGRCKWHIEKDGSLYDKGTGITKYSEVPDVWTFDINTMQFKDSYKTWRGGEKRELTIDQEKAVKDLKALILRWERTVNNMNGMGDGTKETEEAAKEQQTNEKLVKVIKKVVKKVIKPVPVDRKMVKIGDFLKVKDHICYWKVIDINEERKTFTYEQVGKKYQDLKNGKRYYDFFRNLDKDGYYIINELKEVEEVQEVEKWVKPTIKKTTIKKETIKAKDNKTSEAKTDHNTDVAITATITLNKTKQGIEIRFSSKPDSEIRSSMKLNGFRWGGVKNNCWYVKQSETSIKFANNLVNSINKNNDDNLHTEDGMINNSKTTKEPKETTTDSKNNNPYEQDKIEKGYIYNCHFKVWDYTIEQIHNELKTLNINYTDMDNKIGFKNVNYSNMLKIENLNNKNGSILFIDSKVKINNITEENPNVINMNNYKKDKEEDINNMSILDKFENIEIKNTDKISLEDKKYCEIHNEAYNKTLKIYKQTLYDLIELYNEQIKTLPNYKKEIGIAYNIYVDKYGDSGINKIIDAIQHLQNTFISNICNYFNNKYSITIESDKIYNKYKSKELQYDRSYSDNTINKNILEYIDFDYNNILDEIFEQLGGFTFNEKASNEIIENMKKICIHSYDNENNAKLKNKKITINNFFYLNYIDKKYGTDKVNYSSDENFKALLIALSHFEQGITNNSYTKIYNDITNGENERCITTHSLMCIKVESLKLFKNGKIEIIFLNSGYAQQFAKMYCGCIEKVA